MFNNQRVAAIIAAAGSSERMEGIDKIFTNLGNRPVLARTVYPFECTPLVDRIVVVLNENNLAAGEKLAENVKWRKVTDIVAGGARRQDSVMNALKKLENDVEWVIIHDGARPLLRVEQIEEGLKAAQASGAAVCAVPVTDTIKLASEDLSIRETLSREYLWAAQTPQIFRYDLIRRAYETATETATDDASLVERLGVPVKLYRGSYGNIKITTPESLAAAEMLWRRSGE
ncbi:2-C-methyl-D-erythritol 4-phosphate cytidylyltransferase [Dehalogenimonas sp. THU2]|uniref:2-C-methyl-D-erythritol 4-phosphate cytidylyltransferase n=1 Tax=Dehalogenimonas sp. THU2 TaxID=3151121 RepID=UPI0032184DCE